MLLNLCEAEVVRSAFGLQARDGGYRLGKLRATCRILNVRSIFGTEDWKHW